MTHDFKSFPELTNSQMAIYYFDSPHQQITGSFHGRVTDVHDGDTCRVATDFRDFDTRVRFSNIAAPELNEGGEESRDFMKQLIEGKEVYVVVDPKNRVGKWGRIIGDVMIDGISAGVQSINEGHSIPFGQAETGQLEQQLEDFE